MYSIEGAYIIMDVEKKESKKEDYITSESISAKTQEWLEEIAHYAKNRGRFEYNPSSSALLVIDMQEFFLNEKSHAFIFASKAIISNVNDLIEAFRRCNLPVIFTRHSYKENEEPGIMGKWWGDVIRENDPHSKIIHSLAPKEEEVILRKTRYSAFYNTELEDILKRQSIESLVITGVMTHLCCETTAREAFMRDYEVYFVVDGTATQNEELHLSSLKTLSNGFAIPVTTNEILKEIEGCKLE